MTLGRLCSGGDYRITSAWADRMYSRMALFRLGRLVRKELIEIIRDRRTIITLVMQNLDNSITTFTKRGLRGRHLSSKQGHGEPNPTWIPVGNEATRRIADRIDGATALVPINSVIVSRGS